MNLMLCLIATVLLGMQCTVLLLLNEWPRYTVAIVHTIVFYLLPIFVIWFLYSQVG